MAVHFSLLEIRVLWSIFHFERRATPLLDAAMKRRGNILCPINVQRTQWIQDT